MKGLRFYRILFLIFLFGIVGCSQETVKPQQKDANFGLDPLPKATEKKPLDDSSQVTTKKASLDPQLLYTLMVAEMAGQREQYNLALDGYLHAAKRVDDIEVAKRATQLALVLKQNEKASEAVDIWLANEPENIEARRAAVLLSARGDDKDSLRTHLEYLYQVDPSGFEESLVSVTKAMPRSKGNQSDLLFEELEHLALKNPDQAIFPYLQALLASQAKKEKSADEKIQQAVKLRPDWENALLLQAQLAAHRGDYTTARFTLQNMINKNPGNMKLRKMFGQLLLKQESYKEALQQYQIISEQNPDDSEAAYSSALIYMQLKQDDKAESALKKLVNKPELRAQASYYMGRIAARKGDYDEALVWFDKVTFGPLSFESKMSAVGVLIEQEHFSQALSRVEAAEDEFPDQLLRITLLKAELFSIQKQHQESFDVLTQGLTKLPGSTELLYTRALVAEKLDRLDIVEKDLKFILKSKPDDANALNALGYTLVDKSERYSEAESYLLKALEIKPDEPVILDSYGWLKYKLGEYPEALEYLEKAYSKEQDAEIAAHYIEILWASGKKSQAREIYLKALKKDPESEKLKQISDLFSGSGMN